MTTNWNGLEKNKRVMLAIISKLSKDSFDYLDFTDYVIANLKCEKESMGGLISGLHKTGLTESGPTDTSVKCLLLTEEGKRFISDNQKMINEWAEENNVHL